MILEQLGIYGWSENNENLLLASLLTGDPVLLIGNHGTAKTHTALKMAEALNKTFIAYDASKALFEDVLGYPDINKLKEGQVSYIPSKVTLWDKEFTFIDELNRALPEMQNKWLEIIRSRKIMGFDTKVKWVWAAMNPFSYSATQVMDEALVGRFALFIYPPEILEMNEQNRMRIAAHINGDDAPALNEWTVVKNGRTIEPGTVATCGEYIHEILRKAATYFKDLQQSLPRITEFLAKYADLLARETNNDLRLDGRRLGFIYRNILANRSIELAKAELNQEELPDMKAMAVFVIQSSIPIGLNDEGAQREESLHKLEICYDLLKSYFEDNGQPEQVELIYELFTTTDLIRKTEILLKEDLGELAKSKAWHDMMERELDITVFAYVALQVEAQRPGTIPPELMENLSQKIDTSQLSPDCLGNLHEKSIEHVEAVEALLLQKSDMGKLLAIQRVKDLADNKDIKPDDIERTRALIEQDIETFHRLTQE